MLHQASTFEINILYDTDKGKKRRLINISELAREYGQNMGTTLMSLRAFTNCDTARAYNAVGNG